MRYGNAVTEVRAGNLFPCLNDLQKLIIQLIFFNGIATDNIQNFFLILHLTIEITILTELLQYGIRVCIAVDCQIEFFSKILLIRENTDQCNTTLIFLTVSIGGENSIIILGIEIVIVSGDKGNLCNLIGKSG